MEISIIFDRAFQGRTAGAVWIMDSAENRRWFERQTDLDMRSALFTPEGGEIGQPAILRSVWNVQEHYPEWSRINVIGASLPDGLFSDLHDEDTVTTTEHGFSLIRS